MKPLFQAILLGSLFGFAALAEAQVSIMPMGDSITAGGGAGQSGPGYRSVLYNDLIGNNVNFSFSGLNTTPNGPTTGLPQLPVGYVSNNGYGSYTLADINSNLAANGTKHSTPNNGGYWITGGNPTTDVSGGATNRPAVSPDVVLLMAGTNDADYSYANGNGTVAGGFGLTAMENSLHGILTWFATNRPNTTVIVGTVIPWNKYSDNASDFASTTAQINAYNAWLKNTELANFPQYRLVDMNPLFKNSDGSTNTALFTDTSDGIHPNSSGYMIMGHAWNKALNSLGLIPRWKGDGSANVWNVGGAANFAMFTSGSAAGMTSSVTFAQNSIVYFDDLGSASPAIALTGALTPGAVTVSASQAYTFAGSGSLGGAMILTKDGTGTLALVTDNTYTGGTVIAGGTVQVGTGGTSGSLGTGTVTNGGILAVKRSDTVTVSNSVTGAGSLQQTGAGTTILTGANDYSGTTTITTGTLQIGSGSTAGTLGSGPVVNNASLAFNRSDDVTVSNAISGSGSFTKLGADTLALGGTQTYTGATIISGGTLKLQGLPPLLATNLLYQLSTASASGYTMNVNGVNVDTFKDLSGHNNNFTSGGTTNGPTVLTGASGLNGLNVFHFDGSSNTRKLVQTASTSAKSLFIVNRPAVTQTASLLPGIWGQNGADLGIRLNSPTAWQYSSGNSSDYASTSAGSMWINGVAVASNANGSFTSGAAQTLEAANTAAGTWAGALGSYWTGGTRPYTGDIAEVIAYSTVLSATDRQSVEAYLNYKWFGPGLSVQPPLPSGTAVNITQSGAALDLNGVSQSIGSLTGISGSNVTLGGAALTVSNATSTTFAGSITDAGGSNSSTGGSLLKTGASTLTLSGTSSFTGGTQVNGGTLTVTGTLTNTGATITVGNGATLNVSSGTVTAAAIHVLSGGTLTGSGTINGAINIDAGGNSTLTFNTAPTNTFTGPGTVTINTGGSTFVTGNASSFNAFTGTLNLNSTGTGKLALTTTGQNFGSGAIVNVNNGATLFLATGATFSGVTFNVTGNGNGESLGALRIEGVTIAANSTINLLSNSTLGGNNTATTIAGTITGNGFGFTKTGSNNLILTGANTFTGPATVSSGTLTLAQALALQNSTFSANSALANSGVVFSAAVTGNAFTLGGLTGTGGLALQNNAATPAAIALSVGNNNATSTYAGALSGPGSLTKVGNAALILSGSNTYAGTTTVSAGTLRLLAPPIFPSGLQIMPFGDSITYGASGTNGGYRGPLYNLLKNVAPNMLFIGTNPDNIVTTSTNPLPVAQQKNEGHGSYTIQVSSNNLDGYDPSIFNQYGPPSRDPMGGHWFDGVSDPSSPNYPRAAVYPDIILMMLGTNDASTADRNLVQSQLHNIIAKITTERPNSKLIVAQITPSDRPNNVSFNVAVASEVASFQAAGKMVSLVDLYSNFPAGGISGDGTHPNDTGYNFMALQWCNGLVAVASTGKGVSMSIPSASPLAIASGATFDLDGAQTTVSQISGAGSITLGAGGILTDTNASGFDTTFSGAISGAGNVIKSGAGKWTLAGANSYTGTTQITGGTLALSGSITNNSSVDVLNSTTLAMADGTLTANTLHIASGGTLTGSGTINATVTNDNSATISSGSAQALSFSGNLINNGLIQLTGGSALLVGGTITNNGTLDLITGSQTLPAGLVNNGTLLTPIDFKVSTFDLVSGNAKLTVQSYSGHNYQLGYSTTLASGSWQSLGGPQPGNGGILTFTSPAATAGLRVFYRIQISP